jgi:hypothetical protein
MVDSFDSGKGGGIEGAVLTFIGVGAPWQGMAAESWEGFF